MAWVVHQKPFFEDAARNAESLLADQMLQAHSKADFVD